MKWCLWTLIGLSTILVSITTYASEDDAFKVGECAYEPLDKAEFPNSYTIRKIVDVSEENYIFQLATNPKDLDRHLFAERIKSGFERDFNKMKCPSWFK